MKRITFFIFTSLFFFSGISQALPIEEQNETNYILNQFVTIEKNQVEYAVQTKKLSDESQITVWSKDGSIKQVIINAKSPVAKSEDHFYFDEQKLILCRSITESFKISATGELSEKAETEKHYLLYKKGELIKPNVSGNINQTYIDLGMEKRNLLIQSLAQAFIKP